jgi:hypothetical protein
MDLEDARRRREAGETGARAGRTTPRTRAHDARLRREIREAFDRQRAGHLEDAAVRLQRRQP